MSTGLNESFACQLDNLLNSPTGDGVLSSKPSSIRKAAFHDFSEYRYLMTPLRQLDPVDPDANELDTGDSSPEEPERSPILNKDQFVSYFEDLMHELVTTEVPDHYDVNKLVQSDPDKWEIERHHISDRMTTEQLASSMLFAFDEGMGWPLFSAFQIHGETFEILDLLYAEVTNFALNLVRENRISEEVLWNWHIDRLISADAWSPGVDGILNALSVEGSGETTAEDDESPLADNYGFEPYLPGSINFGLQLVYRQFWTPLGTQPGEIVRTLPLGPKQIEKVTIKAIQRTKTTRQSETITIIEKSTDGSASTKDSSDVVEEAAKSFNWNVEAKANARWGWGGASLKSSMGGESASSSSESKSKLNETMEKTASKMRSESKVMVSTETEESTEIENYSEITNPNDEIAVTYVYSRMQQQYEVHTTLNDANTVIFVAEPLPLPSEINGDWIRRNDWILARELLDETFRDDLNNVIRQGGMVPDDEEIDGRIAEMMESLKSGLPPYESLPGSLPDIFRNPQQAYEREIERKRERTKDRKSYFRSLKRLQLHIFENILHYCRAIWGSEDPNMRLMRYEKIRVPIKWQFVADSLCGEEVTDPGCEGYIEGYYTPDVTDTACDTVQLNEIIDPVGPIGFIGNYSVFYFRQTGRYRSLENVLRHINIPYSQLAVNVEHANFAADSPFRITSAAGPGRISEGFYQLRFSRAIGGAGGFEVTPECGLQFEAVLNGDDSTVEFLDLCIKIDKRGEGDRDLQDGDTFLVSVRIIPVLEDPELKAIRCDYPPPSQSAEEHFYNVDFLERFAELFPKFAYEAEIEGLLELEWNLLSSHLKSMVRNNFAEYILRDRHTRQLLLDTNNVLLSRVVDDASTLEPFKGLHRYLDVLNAHADFRNKQLENERRETRISQNKLGDPDIEKVTVVAGSREAAELAGLDVLTPDPGEDGGDES